MKELLMDLTKIRGVLGAVVVAKDGMLIASDLAVDVEEEVVGAMFSAIGNVIGRASDLLHMGNFVQAIVDAKGGKIFIADSGFGFIGLVTIDEVNIGLVRLELRKAAEVAMTKLQAESGKPQEERITGETEEGR